MSLTMSPPASEQVILKRPVPLSLAGIPLYVYASSLAALFIMIGITWDISWHMTIGRDKLLSPPHNLIYLGAVFGGLFSGIQVLWNTFGIKKTKQKDFVKVWGFFYSPLGALFCIWGAVAMLTSAPFDDWWHNTYGLDITILSPPHTLLGLGMLFLMFGSCVSISKYVNVLDACDGQTGRSELQRKIYQGLFLVSASSLLCMSITMFTEYTNARDQHGTGFYQITATVILLFLPAFSKALRLKWGMTAVSIGYFAILSGCNWVLQQFHAEPKLGPILNPVTFFQPLQFPILVFIPAIAMDLLTHKLKYNDWIKAVLLSVIFVLILLLIQYPFSSFLLESQGARNKFFGSESWLYSSNPEWIYRYKFGYIPLESPGKFTVGLLLAMLLGTVAARLSLRWGNWLMNIYR